MMEPYQYAMSGLETHHQQEAEARAELKDLCECEHWRSDHLGLPSLRVPSVRACSKARCACTGFLAQWPRDSHG